MRYQKIILFLAASLLASPVLVCAQQISSAEKKETRANRHDKRDKKSLKDSAEKEADELEETGSESDEKDETVVELKKAELDRMLQNNRNAGAILGIAGATIGGMLAITIGVALRGDKYTQLVNDLENLARNPDASAIGQSAIDLCFRLSLGAGQGLREIFPDGKDARVVTEAVIKARMSNAGFDDRRILVNFIKSAHAAQLAQPDELAGRKAVEEYGKRVEEQGRQIDAFTALLQKIAQDTNSDKQTASFYNSYASFPSVYQPSAPTYSGQQPYSSQQTSQQPYYPQLPSLESYPKL